MTDELWRHALDTLDSFKNQKSSEKVEDFYNYEDATGILKNHEKVLGTDNGKVHDPKTMYFELIKMLLENEKRHSNPEAFKKAKEVTKIQGYQDLTNKLLRNINQRLVEELAHVSEKLARIEKVVGTEEAEGSSSSDSEGEDSVGSQTGGSWAQRIAQLEKDVGVVKGENNRVRDDVEELTAKLKTVDEVDAENKKAHEIQLETFKALEERLDKNEEHIVLLQNHDDEQDDHLKAIQEKVEELEKADTFLQGIHEEAAKKAQGLDEVLKEQLNDHKILRENFEAFCESKGIQDDKIVTRLEKYEDNLKEALEKVGKDHEKGMEELKDDFNDNLEKISEKINKDREIQGEELKHDVENIKNKIEEVEDALKDLNERNDDNFNIIKALNEKSEQVDKNISKIEVDASMLSDELFDKIGDNKTTLDEIKEKMNRVISDVEDLEDKAKEVVEIPMQQEELKQQMVALKLDLEKLEDDQSKELSSKINILSDRVQGNMKMIDDAKDVINANKGQLMRAQESIGDIQGDLNQFKNNQQKAVEHLTTELNSLENKLEDVEGKENALEDKVFKIEEKTLREQEEETFAKKVERQLYAVEAEKQQSEAKLKEELDNTAYENKKNLDEIRDILDQQLREIREKTDTHETQIDNLQGGQKEMNDALEDVKTAVDNHEAKGNLLESQISKSQDKLEELEKDLKQLPTHVKDNVVEHITDMKNIVDEKINEVNAETDKNGVHVENLRQLNQKLIDTIKTDVDDIKSGLGDVKALAAHDQDSIVEQIKQVRIKLDDFDRDEIDDLKAGVKNLEERLDATNANLVGEIAGVANMVRDDNDKAVKELNDKLSKVEEAELPSIRTMVEELATKQNDRYDDVANVIEKVQDEVGEVAKTYKDTAVNITTIRKEVDSSHNDIWKLLLEVYGALRGYTVVLRSKGRAAVNQAACLGIYRMVDSYGGKPVYKQEEGENYLYYNGAKRCWMVGTNVGDGYAWIKSEPGAVDSSSDSEGGSDSDSSVGSTGSSAKGKRRLKKAKRVPDLLQAEGWRYKPDPLELAETDQPTLWLDDDKTLTVEALRDIEVVGDVIRQIRNAREID